MKLLYKLAKDNLKRNREIYLPYLFVFIGSISVFFLIMNLSFNNSLAINIEEYKHLESIRDTSFSFFTDKDFEIYVLGQEFIYFKDLLLQTSIVVIIITVIFNLYSTNYILKRRLKDYGIYNVMGVDEKFIKKLIVLEIAILNLLGIIIGIVLGIILDRLNFLIIFKVMDFNGFSTNNISLKIILLTMVVFAVITFISFVFVFIKMKNMKSLDLIYEKEIKTRSLKYDLLFSIFGMVLIALGYYLSSINNVSYYITNNKSLKLGTILAIIICITVGTFMLFQGMTVGIINILRKNNRFYKKKKNFVAISNLRYRLRANAIALGSICMLGLMVLLSISFTINTYIGFKAREKKIDLSISVPRSEQVNKFKKRIDDQVKEYNIEIEDYFNMELITGLVTSDEEGIKLLKNQTDKYRNITLINIEDFNDVFQVKENIGGNETIVLGNYLRYKEEIESNLRDEAEIFKEKLKVKKIYNIDYDMSSDNMNGDYILVVSDKIYDKMAKRDEKLAKKYMYFNDDGDYVDEEGNLLENPIQQTNKSNNLYFKFKGDNKDKRKFIEDMDTGNIPIFEDDFEDGFSVSYYNKFDIYNNNVSKSSYVFVSVYLAIILIFNFFTVLYYKQVVEGYEDAKQMGKLYKVGLTDKEIQSTINKQILIFFFLPLVISVIHFIFLTGIMTNLVEYVDIISDDTLKWAFINSVIIYILLYLVSYYFTAKRYHKIILKRTKIKD